MYQPVRGGRESAMTRRWNGLCFAPRRINRIFTIDLASLSPFLFNLPHLPDQLLRLAELLQQAVDVLDRRPAASGDTAPPAAVDDVGIAPLIGRHRADDRLHAP